MDAQRLLRRLAISPKLKVQDPKSARRLRPAERRLADALDQLRAGVPLNWTQMEDDPELVTLVALQGSAQEYRRQPHLAPPDLRLELFEELSRQLPAPKAEPAKAQPKSLAGYSESLAVLTQPEEDVPDLRATLLPRVALVAGVIASLILVAWVINALAAALRSAPVYTWLDVREGGRVVYSQRPPAGWSAPSCLNPNPGDASRKREFITIPDKSQLQLNVGFPIDFLPLTLSAPSTYTLRLTEMGISPCAEIAPDPADPAAIVKLYYLASHPLGEGYVEVSPLAVFVAKQLPATLDVTKGSLKEVQVGESRGAYWQGGGPYVDIEGNTWAGSISVMVVERDDIVTTFIGDAKQGITEEMLLQLLGSMESTRQQQATQPIPAFNWIEMRKGNEVLSPRQPVSDTAQLNCTTIRSGDSSRTKTRFVTRSSLLSAQASMGFPFQSLPETTTLTTTITIPRFVAPTPGTPFTTPQFVTVTAQVTNTFSLADIWVRPCAAPQLQASDLGAAVKQRYTVHQTATFDDSGSEGREDYRVSDIILFQMRQQPTTLDVTGGTWKEVRIGDAHGIFWQGSPYKDVEGIDWSNEVSVLILEEDNRITVLMGSAAPIASIQRGITEDLLASLVSEMK